MFPEIKDHLINIFERYTHVLDAELQQRACEYLALARRPDTDDLLSAICDEMPVFPERESTLVHRLHAKGNKSQDKRTWVIGGRDENQERQGQRFKTFRQGTQDSNGSNSEVVAAPIVSRPQAAGPSAPPPAPAKREPERQETLVDDMMGPVANGRSESAIMASLADLDLGAQSATQEEPLLNGNVNGSGGGLMESPVQETGPDGEFSVLTATLGGVDPALVAPLTVAPNIEKVSYDLCF